MFSIPLPPNVYLSAGDKRMAEREEIQLPATILIGTRANPCLAVNASADGARLIVDATRFLPSRFQVRIPARNISRLVRLVWRKGDHIGVAFL